MMNLFSAWCLIAIFADIICIASSMSLFMDDVGINEPRHLTAEDLAWNWKLLANLSHDPSRSNYAKFAIEHAAGAYRDHSKAKRVKSEKTVLVNVLSFNKENLHVRYQNLLNNWYCFAAHHGLRPLTYLVPNENQNFTDQVKDLHSIGIYGDFVTYPNELFWSIVAEKTTSVVSGRGKVDFGGTIPSFSRFGAMVMLIPILEVLEAGYDAIYIDLDVAFVHDPIPYLLKGMSDFSVSIEMKTCFCPSVYNVALVTDWKAYEPNTGIMRIRSTPQSIKLFRRWLQKIVDGNVANDQKSLEFVQFGARLSYDCNEQLNLYSDELLDLYNKSIPQKYQQELNATEPVPKYCFLNEYLFQNGKLALNCAFNRGGSFSEYLIAMKDQNFTKFNESSQIYERMLEPAIVHLNYCDDKIEEFKKLGLWLPFEHSQYHSQLCRKYNYEDTIYGKTDWNAKLAEAEKEMDKVRKIVYNGSLIKLHRWPTHYMYMNGKLRAFPNGETFEAMGLNWKDFHYPGPYNLLKSIPAGETFPEIEKKV